MNPEISVFVPCYNEEQIIEKHILAIYNACIELKKPIELVIVDDGSTDNTPMLAQKIAKQHKEIQYIYYANGPSRRENLAKAFRIARGDIIIFMDLDLSVPLSYLSKILDGITSGNDIVIGSRYKGSKTKRTLSRFIISMVYNWFMRFYFGSFIADHQCGFKGFKKKILFSILDKMGYDEKFIRGWFWDVELLVRAQRDGYAIDEFSVDWKSGKQSSFDIKRELKMIPYLLKLRWKV